VSSKEKLTSPINLELVTIYWKCGSKIPLGSHHENLVIKRLQTCNASQIGQQKIGPSWRRVRRSVAYKHAVLWQIFKAILHSKTNLMQKAY